MMRIFVLGLLLVPYQAFAYLETTHEKMSEYAVDLALNGEDNGFSAEYFSWKYNIAFDYESFVLPRYDVNNNNKTLCLNEPYCTIRELIRNGASFEDSLQNEKRPLHHFYDPIHDRPLTVLGAELGHKSPDWALEDQGELEETVVPPRPRQDYSYRNAMNCFYGALTSRTQDERHQNWSCTFHLLGHVIHHVQDMAQPDHVRNDQHVDFLDPSWFESFTGDLVTFQDTAFYSHLNSSYPVPLLDSARDYWTTRAADGSDNPLLRVGLSDFTNRNFVSKDTIFKYNDGIVAVGSTYTLPDPSLVLITKDISDPDVLGPAGQTICNNLIADNPDLILPGNICEMQFVSTVVNDEYMAQSEINDRAATRSLFDKELVDFNRSVDIDYGEGPVTVDRLFSLNKINFKAAHYYLVPRAVSYSAGIIDYFFKVDLGMLAANNGFGEYVDVDGWRIINFTLLSDDSNMIYKEYELEGLFELFYWANENGDIVLRPLPGAQWHTNDYTTSGSLTPDEWWMQVPAPATFPSNLASNKFQLVFKGRVGAEGDPNAYLDTNNTNYSTGGYYNVFSSTSASQVIHRVNDTSDLLLGDTLITGTLYVNALNSLNTFNRQITLVGYDLHPDFPDDLSVSNKVYRIDNHFAAGYYNAGHDYVVVEYPGSQEVGSYSGQIHYGELADSAIYPMPDENLIASLPYGYQVHAAEYGIISKYPSYTSYPDDSLFYVYEGHAPDSFNGSVRITRNPYTAYRNRDTFQCERYNLSNINANWPAVYAYYYTDQLDFNSDNPAQTLITFLQTDILRRPGCSWYTFPDS